MTTGESKGHDHPVVLFDGYCNLCNWWVDFILRHDRAGHLRFAALQSPAGQSLLGRGGLPGDRPESVVLVDGSRCYTRSGAALRIARLLDWPWPLLSVFWVVPWFLRDAIYAFIAHNRYRWFGRRLACRMPTEEERGRFLE